MCCIKLLTVLLMVFLNSYFILFFWYVYTNDIDKVNYFEDFNNNLTNYLKYKLDYSNELCKLCDVCDLCQNIN